VENLAKTVENLTSPVENCMRNSDIRTRMLAPSLNQAAFTFRSATQTQRFSAKYPQQLERQNGLAERGL